MFKKFMLYVGPMKNSNELAFYDEVKLNKCFLVYKQFYRKCSSYVKNMLTCSEGMQIRLSGRYNQRNTVWSPAVESYKEEGSPGTVIS